MMEITQLVEQAQRGSSSDYDQLVSIYQRLAIIWAWRIVGDFHVAQDLAQDAFVIGFRKLNTLRTPASFPGWISEIVRREALQYVRKHDSCLPLDVLTEPIGRSEQDPFWLDRHAATINAIQTLPSHEQEVIVLHYLEGHSTPVVAEFLDRPVGTVTKQLSRAIKRLQSLLVEVRDESK